MPVRAGDRAAAALPAQARLQRGGLLLALVVQLQIIAPALRGEAALVQRHLDRAARLAAVAAVGEAALFGQRADVGEQVEIFLAGEFQFAHAGRVDQAAAAGQLQQGAIGGGVATAAVVAAHRGGGHRRGAQQGVGEGGFAGTGGTHQHRAVARLQVRREQRHAGRVLAVERVDRRAGRQPRAQRVDGLLRIRAGVELAQQHHRLRAGVLGQRQIALDPRRVEVAVQSGQHQHIVDVGGDQLALVALAGRCARQCGAPRRHADDVRRRARGHFDEIAHRRALAGVDAALEEMSVRLRTEQGLTVVQLVAGAVLGDHPRQREAGGRQRIAAPADASQAFDRFGITHEGDLTARFGDYALPRHGPLMNRCLPCCASRGRLRRC